MLVIAVVFPEVAVAVGVVVMHSYYSSTLEIIVVVVVVNGMAVR